MAATDIGTTEVASTVAEVVNSMVQSYLAQESKLMGLVTNYAAPAGMDTVKIPRAGGFTPAAKVENTNVATQSLTFATDDLVLDQYKAVQVLVEDNAALQSAVDVRGSIIERMAKDMATDIDNYIFTQIDSVSATTPDHRIALTGASLAIADILAARTLLHAQNISMSDCYLGIAPDSEASLLSIENFIDASRYGDSSAIKNGELGTIYGAKVIVSNAFNAGEALVWHPSHVGFAKQMSKFETARDVPALGDLYSVSHLYGAVTLDSGKRGVLLGSAT